MGFWFDREREHEHEPEILDNAQQEHGTWLRACATWLSGQGGPLSNGEVSRLRRVPRWMVATTVVAVMAGGVATLALTRSHAAPSVIEPIARNIVIPAVCGEMVNLTTRQAPLGYRVEFGDVAVPPAFQQGQGFWQQGGPPGWQYAEKTGFAFLGSGPPAVISVPPAWQNTVALATPSGPASTLNFPSCPIGARWNTYISVFYLHSPTVCVPLQIQAGRHSTMDWFGLGRHCTASDRSGGRR